jgi:NitT/TauT family transport system permease protein
MATRWPTIRLYQPPSLRLSRLAPNVWDAAALALLFATLVGLAHGAREALAPIAALHRVPISLSPSMLPEYALRTTLRMFAAIFASLVFTFVFATLAAKNRKAELIIVPALDVLQSVPVLSFLTFTTIFFLNLFPGSVLGIELASIFLIFTAQAWNMAFSFYQSLKSVPKDLEEVSASFHLTGWQRFWRLEAPFAAPGLVWNTMLSMSGSWFFLVVSEAITVHATTIKLPGIGSYVAAALDARDLHAIGYAILTMFLVILAYDQLLFRPIVAWAEKFRFEQTASGEPPTSWILDMVGRARWITKALRPLGEALRAVARWPLFPARRPKPATAATGRAPVWGDRLWLAVVLVLVASAVWRIADYVGATLQWSEVVRAIVLGALTLVRVIVLITLATLVWVPIGVWIGLRPRVAQAVQPIAQFLAAFPANLLFPVFVVGILTFRLNPDIWLSPLMVLGTQWYILFNVIAGASVFPGDLKEASASLGIKGWNWWRRVMLPGIAPYYITGAITASGGSWNASIVAEAVTWGHDKVEAHGLGAYIFDATEKGDYPRIVLGTAVMSLFVIAFNRLLWRPLYAYAAKRLRHD